MKSWTRSLVDCFAKPYNTWKTAKGERKYTIGLLITPLSICVNLLLFCLVEVILLAIAIIIYHFIMIGYGLFFTVFLVFTDESSVKFLRSLWHIYTAHSTRNSMHGSKGQAYHEQVQNRDQI